MSMDYTLRIALFILVLRQIINNMLLNDFSVFQKLSLNCNAGRTTLNKRSDEATGSMLSYNEEIILRLLHRDFWQQQQRCKHSLPAHP